MKRKRNRYLRTLIKCVQLRYSLARIFMFPRTSPKRQAKILASLLFDMTELYRMNPRAPHHIPLYPFCGIPIFGLVGSRNFDPAEIACYLVQEK